MALSNDLITQFAKISNKKEDRKKESIVYGTVEIDGTTYVKIDGSELRTPVTTTSDVKNGDRVTVTIKNHNAVITGNITSPSVNFNSDVVIDDETTATIGNFGTVVSGKLIAQKAEIQEAYIKSLSSERAEINELLAEKATIEQLTADRAEIDELLSKKATIEQLTADRAEIDELLAEKASIEQLTADRAEIDTLIANKIDATSADIKYAQIDFSNIDKAWIGKLYALSGIIENVDVKNQTITGTLAGVTIKGDLIEGNTVVADKLVIKGEDGLYYKLNTQAVTNSSYTDKYIKTDEIMDAVDGSLLEGIVTSTNEQVYSYIDTEENTNYYCIIDSVYYKVLIESPGSKYIKTDKVLDDVDGDILEGIFTSTNEQVYSYIDIYGNTNYYCVVDSIYYAVSVESLGLKLEQTEYNSLNGSIITAKSITAEQINVSDLVAFDATIGGFEIGSNSISSYAKDSDKNTVRGIYMDTDGQFNFGDSNNFVRYYRDEDGTYKLAISAESIMYRLNGTSRTIADIGALTEYVKIGTYEYDSFTIPDPIEQLDITLPSDYDEPGLGTVKVDSNTSKVVRRYVTSDGEILYFYVHNYGSGSSYYRANRLTEPCIELGEKDSDFRLIITNTRIMFLEGDSLPAYVSNQALNISKAVIEDELQIGGFIWKKRSNGNVGLMWKG